MKKILALVLAAIMMFSLVACGSDAEAEKKVAAYVEKNRAALIQSMESSFATTSGMTCKTSIEVEGCGFSMYVRINELDNVPESVKDKMQDSYDAMDSYFESMLNAMQKELPELEYWNIYVCEKDGDVLASIEID